MRTFNTQAAQGDLLIRRIDALPEDIPEVEAEGGRHVVAHSETGHHHTLPATSVQFYRASAQALVAYLVVKKVAELKHHRPTDTHESIEMKPGIYEIRRQREYTPEGWRRVED